MMNVRLARRDDVPEMTAVIDASVRELQRDDYTPAQLESALGSVYAIDVGLIDDGTYFAVETEDGTIAGCGGWSRRAALHGGDVYAGHGTGYLDPRVDAAKIRAFYVHPAFARQGVGSLLLSACEAAARSAGFTRLEMGATITGVRLYERRGYERIRTESIALPNGEFLAIVVMAKPI
jgi:GNAT superfamily N-acetyltransferase